ncbi:NADPH-dependent FMN reductase [Tritonibacter scottomollicae]|uniref:NADPH-dependent FMN reductase n=1 Tax=Tritonibacter scottomollicae TaxID=483013 RepID=A0ABZ0HJQ7_TRISK|nr:NADPH-dependent FMN reductase [Tritonibacter scottomollicae]WOI34691.1 NADPH-dependent FMN reductase [Tritonibacter scottomollicae]
MMKLLAISGSARQASSNTALLRAVAEVAPPAFDISVFAGLAGLPVFSPDLEAAPLPAAVQAFADQIAEADGLILASPEYVHALPGGLKNAIDWLVSREEIIAKPIALMHGSHRGDEMLAQLRRVLSTVSSGFMAEPFLRLDLLKRSPEEIVTQMRADEMRAAVAEYLELFRSRCTSA